jgi:hypothetical protein
MPQAVQAICRHPGCGKRSQGRFCPSHAHYGGQLDRDRRGSAASRGYGRTHEKWRRLVLGRDPFCQMAAWLPAMAKRLGALTSPCRGFALSTVAHHIVPVRAGGGRFDLENGLGVCKACHDWWTATQEPKIYPVR